MPQHVRSAFPMRSAYTNTNTSPTRVTVSGSDGTPGLAKSDPRAFKTPAGATASTKAAVKRVNSAAAMGDLVRTDSTLSGSAVVQVDAVRAIQVREKNEIVAVSICVAIVIIPCVVVLVTSDDTDLKGTVTAIMLTSVALGVLYGAYAHHKATSKLQLSASWRSKHSIGGSNGRKVSAAKINRIESGPNLDDPNSLVDMEAMCTVCKRQLKEQCRHPVHRRKSDKGACPPAVGKCGHVFHFHCVADAVDSRLKMGDLGKCPDPGDVFEWEWKRREDKHAFDEFTGRAKPKEKEKKPDGGGTGTGGAPTGGAGAGGGGGRRSLSKRHMSSGDLHGASAHSLRSTGSRRAMPGAGAPAGSRRSLTRTRTEGSMRR